MLWPKDDEAGFTLSELLVALLLTGFFVSLIFTFTFGYWRYGYLMEADLDTYVSRLNAGDYLRENISASSGLIIQNSLPDNNTMAPDPNIPSNLYWEEIHAIPSTVTASSTEVKPILYFKRPSVNTSKDIVMNGTQPYEDEYILYLDGQSKTLYARSLANPGATNSKLKTSCPPAISTNVCPADRAIVADVTSIETRYFSRTANLIDHSSITDPITGNYIGPDFSVVEVLELTINIEKKPILQKLNATKNSTIIRIALRNT